VDGNGSLITIVVPFADIIYALQNIYLLTPAFQSLFADFTSFGIWSSSYCDYLISRHHLYTLNHFICLSRTHRNFMLTSSLLGSDLCQNVNIIFPMTSSLYFQNTLFAYLGPIITLCCSHLFRDLVFIIL